MNIVLPDLASRLLGGGVVDASDEFFAARDNLVNPAPPRFTPHVFGPKGQLYDGWETRRRREPGHDHATVRLGAPGVVREVVVDTAFFSGNFPPHASVEACGMEGYPSPAELAAADWVTIVPYSPLSGDSRTAFTVDSPLRFTHVRLCIYPDGGVARLRVHGEAVPDPRFLLGGLVDLAAAELGGSIVDCSNMHYGSAYNLLVPGLAQSMGEGWETARRRDDGNDWVEIRLAVPGLVRLVELDTTHFKGNAPAAAEIRGILPRTRLQPDTRHRLLVGPAQPATQVRLEVYPDGGMARLRLYGEPTEAGRAALTVRWFNLLPAAQARQLLADAPDAARILAARPLTDIADLPIHRIFRHP